jgi:hypothetical protein
MANSDQWAQLNAEIVACMGTRSAPKSWSTETIEK